MKYISVVPAVRTPFGVDVFDYSVHESTDVRAGDLVMISFRKKKIPALIVSVQSTSAFSGKTITIDPIQTLIRFPTLIANLLENASNHSFASRPSVLHSWLRRIPSRLLDTISVQSQNRTAHPKKPIQYVTSSPSEIIQMIQNEKNDEFQGRTLIITPWQSRADAIAKYLGIPALHAHVPYAQAWKIWTSWLGSPTSCVIDSGVGEDQSQKSITWEVGGNILVTTRLGAWLSHSADRIIVDEPENDDHKEDEQEPRLDARWIVDSVQNLNPSVDVIQIGTTPKLPASFPNTILWETIPSIDPKILYDHKQRGGYSEIKRLSNYAIQQIHDALLAYQPVIIIDPYRDDEFQQQIHSELGLKLLGSSSIPIFNLSDLHQTGLPKNALVILLDIAGIGGVIEDIRKKERGVIAWRRLCSRLSLFNCRLLVQGDEAQLEEARSWLTPTGLKATWETESKSRHTFKYPPAHPRIKIIVIGDKNVASNVLSDLENRLPNSWTAEGVHEVQMSASRTTRWIIHVLPKKADQDPNEIHEILRKFAKTCIIDLDPIAFFR
ncbi:MAG: hypothetical protein NUV81_02260 [bacterium]|nr:hypothetical protein [bacterium]